MIKNMIMCILFSSILLFVGCTSYVFHEPVSISTKVGAAKNIKEIKQVRAESNNYFFLLIPIISDPRNIHDDLLEEAKKVGGNGVIDYQIRSSSFFMWIFPGIVVNKIEGVATAVNIE